MEAKFLLLASVLGYGARRWSLVAISYNRPLWSLAFELWYGVPLPPPVPGHAGTR